MDGVMRWEILALKYGDDAYPSLALQIARLAQGLRQEDLGLYGGSNIRFGEQFIPTDLSNRILINYYGAEGSFPYVSAADLLSGRVKAELLAGKVVLIGTSALATYDQKVSPFSADMPGVEKNATVVENILANRFMSKSPGVIELAVILITAILLTILLPRLSARSGVIVGFALMAAYLVAAEITCLEGVWLSLIYPLGNMTIILTAQTVSKLLFEEKQSRQIRAMFSSYVTERLVNEMIRNPDMAQLGGQKRDITVLFSDVVGFTTYSENHQPEEVVAILNEYLGAMTDVVLKWEGILDKFIGDAIVVFWGAPMKQDDHAERGVRCALEMQERLDQLRQKWEAEGRTPLASGIGLNSGEAIVGNIGAEGKKMDYTVIGDHVNLGARVEGLTRRYNVPILITEYTLDRLRPAIAAGEFRGVSILGRERVIVKGKDTPVGIFSLHQLDPQAATVVVECDPEKVVRLTEK
jgi:adenylate cyclase